VERRRPRGRAAPGAPVDPLQRRYLEDPGDLVEAGRLGEVPLETGLRGLLEILGLRVPAQGDQVGVAQRLFGAEGPGHRVTVHAGKADVADDDLRPEAPGQL